MSNSKKGSYVSTIDLTSNTIIDCNSKLLNVFIKTADDVIGEVVLHIGHIDLKNNVPLDRETLIRMFSYGKTYFTYPIKNRMDGLIKVENIIIQLVENPTSSHIKHISTSMMRQMNQLILH